MSADGEHRGRWQLVAMALLFIGPLAVAWTLYLGGLWRPGAGANNGDLIEPVVTLPRTPQPLLDGGSTEGGYLYGRWSLVHWVDQPCDDTCRDTLYKTRQVRLALGREVERIDRVAFVTATDSGDLGPGADALLAVRLAGPAGEEITGALSAGGGSKRIFLVDPLGNLILSYPRDVDPADIRDDLKKLLRVSRIG